MRFLCMMFGHIPDPGYGRIKGSGQGYFRLKLAEKDGMGVQHATLHTECARCGQVYQLGRIHVPQLGKVPTM